MHGVTYWMSMENFKPIIDAYHPILYKIGRSFTRHPVDFEDLYQGFLHRGAPGHGTPQTDFLL